MQNGATSIVGQCIIQLAQYRGIHSINIIRDRCLSEILAQSSLACLLVFANAQSMYKLINN